MREDTHLKARIDRIPRVEAHELARAFLYMLKPRLRECESYPQSVRSFYIIDLHSYSPLASNSLSLLFACSLSPIKGCRYSSPTIRTMERHMLIYTHPCYPLLYQKLCCQSRPSHRLYHLTNHTSLLCTRHVDAELCGVATKGFLGGGVGMKWKILE